MKDLVYKFVLIIIEKNKKSAFDIYKENIDDPHFILNKLGFKPIKNFKFHFLNFSDVVYSKT